MRTSILAIGCLLCTLFVQAQDNAALAAIEKANAQISTLESHFVQTETSAAKKGAVRTEGTLYLSGKDKMAMHYQAPATDLLVINGTDFYMQRGKREKRYDTGKNKAMGQLSNTLLQCLHGTPGQLAQEIGATLAAKKEAKGYVITLTSTKKQARGYAKIILTYDLKTLLLNKMQMDEWNGSSTTYEMNGVKTNASVKPEVFDIPKK